MGVNQGERGGKGSVLGTGSKVCAWGESSSALETCFLILENGAHNGGAR